MTPPRIRAPFRVLVWLVSAGLLAGGVALLFYALSAAVQSGLDDNVLYMGGAGLAVLVAAGFGIYVGWTGRDPLEARQQRHTEEFERELASSFPAIRGSQIAKERAEIGATVEQVAEIAGVAPAHIETWERLDLELPPEARGPVIWATWVLRVRARGDVAGLARCEWVEDCVALGQQPDAVEVGEHVVTCDVCKARLDVAYEPPTGWRAVLAQGPMPAIFAGIVVPLMFAGVVLLGMVGQALVRRDPSFAIMALVLLLALIAGGILGGLTHHVVAPVRARGNVGVHLSWIAITTAYALGVLAVFAVASRIPAIERIDPTLGELPRDVMTVEGVFWLLLATTIGGVILASMAREAERHPRGRPKPAPAPPSPRAEKAYRVFGILACIAALVAMIWIAAPGDAERAEAAYARGWEYQEAGQLAEALARYDEAVRLNPALMSAHHGRGWSLYAMRRYEQSIAAYEEALRLAPDNADAHVGIARALGSVGRFEESAQHAREAIRLAPDYAWGHLVLSLASQRLNQGAQAVASARTAIRLDPDYPGNYDALARALLTSGKYDEAENAYREALERAPDWTFGWIQVARLANQRGAMAQADSAFARANELAPEQFRRSEEDVATWKEVRDRLSSDS